MDVLRKLVAMLTDVWADATGDCSDRLNVAFAEQNRVSNRGANAFQPNNATGVLAVDFTCHRNHSAYH